MLGDRIKEIMKTKKITSKEIADIVGVTPTHISYILNNKRDPSMDLLKKIADTLDISVDDFFEGNTASEKETTLSIKEQEKLDKEAQRLVDELTLSLSKNKEYLEDEDYFAIEAALRSTLEVIKIKNKDKYTPKKDK